MNKEPHTTTTASVTLETENCGSVLYTPTGKISHAKYRVHAQRYRKEWETQEHFRGWLTSIPSCATRAFCLYCKRDLHAHRLSLMKHACTMKHQRAALAAQMNGTSYIENSGNAKMFELENDGKEVYTNIEYLEGAFQTSDIMEYEGTNDESFEEIEDEATTDNTINVNEEEGKVTYVKRDTLTEAMAHIHSENEDQGNNEDAEMMLNYDKDESLAQSVEQEVDGQIVTSNSVILKDEELKTLGNEVIIIKKQPQTARKSMNKVIIRKNPATQTQKKVLTVQGNKVQPKMQIVRSAVTNPKLIKNKGTITAATLMEKTNSKAIAVSSGKSRISTHVTDTTKGIPVSGLQVSLYKLVDGRWTFINESTTTVNGYCNDLMDLKNCTPGRYKLHYDVDKYFTNRKLETMIPFIEVVFDVKSAYLSYHMSMLLSPHSYTVYRGCDKV